MDFSEADRLIAQAETDRLAAILLGHTEGPGVSRERQVEAARLVVASMMEEAVNFGRPPFPLLMGIGHAGFALLSLTDDEAMLACAAFIVRLKGEAFERIRTQWTVDNLSDEERKVVLDGMEAAIRTPPGTGEPPQDDEAPKEE